MASRRRQKKGASVETPIQAALDYFDLLWRRYVSPNFFLSHLLCYAALLHYNILSYWSSSAERYYAGMLQTQQKLYYCQCAWTAMRKTEDRILQSIAYTNLRRNVAAISDDYCALKTSVPLKLHLLQRFKDACSQLQTTSKSKDNQIIHKTVGNLTQRSKAIEIACQILSRSLSSLSLRSFC